MRADNTAPSTTYTRQERGVFTTLAQREDGVWELTAWYTHNPSSLLRNRSFHTLQEGLDGASEAISLYGLSRTDQLAREAVAA